MLRSIQSGGRAAFIYKNGVKHSSRFMNYSRPVKRLFSQFETNGAYESRYQALLEQVEQEKARLPSKDSNLEIASSDDQRKRLASQSSTRVRQLPSSFKKVD